MMIINNFCYLMVFIKNYFHLNNFGWDEIVIYFFQIKKTKNFF